MNYKIIAMDFDGTLLTDEKKVTEETRNTLIEFRNKGYYIIGVTARPFEGVTGMMKIDIFDYIILNNGSNIYESKTKGIFDVATISKSEAKEIIDLVENLSKQIDLISNKKYNIYKNKIINNVPYIKNIKSIDEITESISRINVFFQDKNDVEKYYKITNEKYKNVNCIIMQDSDSEEQWLIITPQGINKKESLNNLGKQLNVELSEMIFFGDGLNDLEVIETVGCGVAMGNALEPVKEKAKDITDTNNNDGIAKYLKKNFL